MSDENDGQPSRETLERIEAQKRIEKLSLEQETLRLEKRSLLRQLSWTGVLLEWLKAATVPAAVLGVLVTYIVGLGQFREAEEARAADRFDKSLTRLASDKASDRITGISGLRLFLSEPSQSRHTAALHFLINALSLETDPIVQSSILDVFTGQDVRGIEVAALNSALKTAVERDRSITASILASAHTRVDELRRERLSQLLKRPADQIAMPIAQQLLDQLPFSDYLTLLTISSWPFDRTAPSEFMSLKGLVGAINALIKIGAKVEDFSGIFCEDCDFKSAGSLPHSNFDNAFLYRAEFDHVDLNHSSFKDADIRQTSFFAADLSGANFSRRWTNLLATTWPQSLPIFECADLRGANLTGVVLMLAEVRLEDETHKKMNVGITVPKILSAKIDKSTVIRSIQIASTKTTTDKFIAGLGGDEKKKVETEIRGNGEIVRNMLPDMIRDNASTTVFRFFRRNDQDSAAFDAGRYLGQSSETGYVQLESIEFERTERNIMLKDWTKRLISQAWTQSGWLVLDQLKTFAATLGTDVLNGATSNSTPDTNKPVAEQATPTPKLAKPSPEATKQNACLGDKPYASARNIFSRDTVLFAP